MKKSNRYFLYWLITAIISLYSLGHNPFISLFGMPIILAIYIEGSIFDFIWEITHNEWSL